MSDGDSGTGSGSAGTQWALVLVSTAVMLTGVGIVGGLAYVELTTSVDAEYERFSSNCEDLDGQTRLIETGLGRETEELNESHVRACRNTTLAEFRDSRTASMRAPPLNLRQWGLYGGAGLLFLVGGAALLRQQLRTGE